MVEHIEKMVEVRLCGHQLWSLWGRGNRSVVVSQGWFDQGTALGATNSAGFKGQCSVDRRHGVQLMGGLGTGVWRREVVGERDSCPPLRCPGFLTRAGSVGRMGPRPPLPAPPPTCPSVYFSLCSGTLTSMGTATSHRRSSRSSVGIFLISAPLGTSTRTSERPGGRGRGKAGSFPLGF